MHRAPSIGFFSALALVTALGARAQIALPKESPFMPAPGAAAVDQPANDTFELKGFSSTGKTLLVCVYDTQAKRSHWIAVDSTVEGIKVVAFDPAKEEATIAVGGQKKTLRMRKSSVAAGTNTPGVAAAGFASPVTAPIVTQGIPQPPPRPAPLPSRRSKPACSSAICLKSVFNSAKPTKRPRKKPTKSELPGKRIDPGVPRPSAPTRLIDRSKILDSCPTLGAKIGRFPR